MVDPNRKTNNFPQNIHETEPGTTSKFDLLTLHSVGVDPPLPELSIQKMFS